MNWWQHVRLAAGLAGLASSLPAADSAAAWAWLHPEAARLAEQIRDLEQARAMLPEVDRPQFSERAGYHSGYALSQTAPRYVQIDLGRTQEFAAVAVVPAFSSAAGDGPYGFPSRFRIDIANDPEFTDAVVIGDQTERDVIAGVAPVFVRAPGARARYVRFTPTKLCPVPGDPQHWFFCVGEILVFAGGSDIARRAPVSHATVLQNLPVWDRLFITDGNAALGFPVVPETPAFNGWCSGPAASDQHRTWVQITVPAALSLAELRLYPTHHPRFPERSAYGFPANFTVTVADDAEFTRAVRTVYSTPRDYTGPGDNPLPINLQGVSARAVRVTATKLWRGTADYLFALAEIELYANGQSAPLSGVVTVSDSASAGEWSVAALTDGRVANGRLLPWDRWLADLARRQEVNAQLAELEPRQQAAQVQAEHRAVGVGAGLVVLAAGGILLLWWRGRRRRAQELIDLRARIARDLHDEIGSHLGSIALMSEMAQRPGADPAAALNEIRNLSQEAATSMRGIVWLVREPGRPSLHRLAETMQQAADLLLRDLVCTFPIPPDDGRQAGLDLHRHMYLFFREAVHNIARHAQARTVEILFSWNAACIVLAIRDDGCGFDPATVSPGSGLANLRHRAAALGGTMTLTSHPGQGTAISLEIPWS